MPQINFEADEELKRRLKADANEEGVTVKELLVKIVSNHLDDKRDIVPARYRRIVDDLILVLDRLEPGGYRETLESMLRVVSKQAEVYRQRRPR